MLIVGLLFCLGAVGGYATGEVGSATFVLLLGFLLLFLALKRLGSPRKYAPTTIGAIPPTSPVAIERPIALRDNLPFISQEKMLRVNPQDHFPLHLYNAPMPALEKAKRILNEENRWDKEKRLFPLFVEHPIRCREVDDYIKKYRPKYHEKMEALKMASLEYQQAGEMDRADLEREFSEQAVTTLYERAAVDIPLLFESDEVERTMIDECIRDFGIDALLTYARYATHPGKVWLDEERKDFEGLLQKGLALSGEHIPPADLLRVQSLKVLNIIAGKEEAFFKRKEKAIEYILADATLTANIGNHVSYRRTFVLTPLPAKFSSVDWQAIFTAWAGMKEHIKLLVDTYEDARNRTWHLKDGLSWAKSITFEKHEDSDGSFICPRAREACAHKYSPTTAPKLPFHVGCNCMLRYDGL